MPSLFFTSMSTYPVAFFPFFNSMFSLVRMFTVVPRRRGVAAKTDRFSVANAVAIMRSFCISDKFGCLMQRYVLNLPQCERPA